LPEVKIWAGYHILRTYAKNKIENLKSNDRQSQSKIKSLQTRIANLEKQNQALENQICEFDIFNEKYKSIN